MPKSRSRNDERSRISHLAARIIAEDGIEDYAAAKRKAARQAGVPDTRQLPTNDEIDAALRTHQTLYGGHALGPGGGHSQEPELRPGAGALVLRAERRRSAPG